MRIAFVESRPGGDPSGEGLRGGLAAIGHHAVIVRPRGRPAGLGQRLLFNLAAGRMLEATRADVVVGRGFDGFAFARRRRTKPYVVLVDRQSDASSTGAVGALLRRLELSNVRRADGVVFASVFLRDDLVRRWGIRAARARVVPPGIDVGAWHGPPPTGDNPTILCASPTVGSLGDLERLSQLVRQNVPKARLLVFGARSEPREHRPVTEQSAGSDAVHLVGDEQGERLRARFLGADLFCYPIVAPPSVAALLPALAAGLPIVAVASGATLEVLAEGTAGLMVPAGNIEALAEAIVGLLGSPNRRQQMAAEGQRLAKRYDWPEIARRFVEELERSPG